ncbi:SIMPL domain-containing protein [uncultured Desulfobacter sp.]|uniref:SIMPL domain-containing protein n=1 Tax=uncultured Desulfobacter sp. TaxID=240139 RepID=UPI002AA6CBE0|nr:SIMPL domain-containing protein [uncultured Desulfobacter sp.]
MKRLMQIIVLLLLSMVSLCSADSQIPQIKVWGKSSSQIRPDNAVLTLKITGKGHNAKAAEELHQKYLDNALNVLSDFGISDKDITMDGPYTNLDGTVVCVLSVRVAEFSKLPGLIQSFASRPGSKVDQLAWSHTRLAQFRADALSMAVKDARQKAQTMIQALNSRLGEALLVRPVDTEKTKAGGDKPFIRIEKKVEVVFRLVPL